MLPFRPCFNAYTPDYVPLCTPDSYKDEEGAPSSRSSRASSTGEDDDGERYYYIEQITGMKDFELTTIYVDFAHLNTAENVLARAIAEQYYRCGQADTELHETLS